MASDIITGIVSGGINNAVTVSEQANAYATDYITQGIVGAIANTGGVSPATGGYAINQSGTPAMTVDVTLGRAYVSGTPSGQAAQVLRAKMSANYTAYVINANTSGSTKYDWIYLKLDAAKAAAPGAASDDVITLYTSRSTSNTSDNGTPPTYGLVLGVVTVANAASSIVDANISDKRVNTTTTAPGFVTNAALAGSITGDKFVAGIPVQIVSSNFTAVATGTTTIPQDDTVPQITEGTEFMTLAITPKSATNILVIEANLLLSSNTTSRNLIAALFQDSTAGALAVNGQFGDDGAADVVSHVNLKYRMVAGTTSATTFRIRAGGQAACTVTFNGVGAGRLFGDICKSSISITEYNA